MLESAESSGVETLSFDYFPGMVFARAPCFTCGEIRDEPALDWTGMTTKALKSVAARFPETREMCKRYDWTLRASYAGLFAGPSLMALSTDLFELIGATPELRVIAFVLGLALLGGSLLLNKDTSQILRALVKRYNELLRQARD
jgi:hypothetical protein